MDRRERGGRREGMVFYTCKILKWKIMITKEKYLKNKEKLNFGGNLLHVNLLPAALASHMGASLVLAVQLLIKLRANASRKVVQNSPRPWTPEPKSRSSWLLALDQTSSSCCNPLGSELADVRSLLLSLSLSSLKRKTKHTHKKTKKNLQTHLKVN